MGYFSCYEIINMTSSGLLTFISTSTDSISLSWNVTRVMFHYSICQIEELEMFIRIQKQTETVHVMPYVLLLVTSNYTFILK